MTEPTDAELLAEWDRVSHIADAGQRRLACLRAVLAKWGTPPAVEGEPDAYLHDDGYWTAAKTDAGRSLNDRLLFAGSTKVAVYTAPQPVAEVDWIGASSHHLMQKPSEVKAGAVPLTREQVKAICVEAGYETAPLQARADFINGIRHAERHHGIKGGQHGAE